jgi:hypothetical protein
MTTATATRFESEAALVLKLAAVALEREHPDYGEAERQIARAQVCIKYARQCNNGTFRGEDW